MARVRIPLVVLGPDGRPLAGATAAVRRRSDGASVNVYAAETGGATLTAPQVVSDAGGRVAGWTDRGALEATVTGPAGSSLTPYVVPWEALPAGDASAEAAWVPDALIITRMVAAGAVPAAALAADVPVVPIGGLIAYAGIVLPAGGRYDWADGGLIDRTTYAGFFGAVGHAYNGGVDPGSNKVRKPDKRGRVIVGADQMPGGVAAGRLPNSNRAVGQNGGEERHALTVAELAAHGHGLNDPGHTHNNWFSGTQAPPDGSVFLDASMSGRGTSTNNILGAGTGMSVQSNGSGTPHNVLQPYEVDTVLVRIL